MASLMTNGRGRGFTADAIIENRTRDGRIAAISGELKYASERIAVSTPEFRKLLSRSINHHSDATSIYVIVLTHAEHSPRFIAAVPCRRD